MTECVGYRAIYFGSYSEAKKFWTSLNHQKESSLIHLVSAAIASFSVSTVTNPLWLVKTRMQLQQKEIKSGKTKAPKYKHSIHCFQVVWKEEGLRGLYKGITASYLGKNE